MALPSGEGGERAHRIPVINSPDWQWPEWQERALCNDKLGTMIGLFFSTQLEDMAAASAHCFECVVREQCLEFAIRTRPNGGVWGGEVFGSNGRIIVSPRKPGRPPAT